jgi:hypothetical protein
MPVVWRLPGARVTASAQYGSVSQACQKTFVRFQRAPTYRLSGCIHFLSVANTFAHQQQIVSSTVTRAAQIERGAPWIALAAMLSGANG